ncbi:Putative two-component system sensor kinase (modular protein) [Nostocoides japonicum T1-X7]|uniref:Putative two-component system sensor kinase (Modular protein) n=1 Tax=Nostocoides japonicum T1-X7 TaxID=1194083 RepID=A0A077LWY1_9MICO|nr:ATP-binding protein [Tetrasphaera japonica]CCH76450.1 Putative two-component system sensor kinase (modular protein) [Tetrasphaera japonica T1-X7]
MPTPYEIREPAEAGSSRAGRSPSGAGRSVRPTMVRPRKGRHLAGVCAGLAGHLGLPVGWVRVAFVVLTVAGGAGVVAYIFLWVLVPEDDGAVQAVPARWLLPDSGPVAQRPTGSRPPMDPAQAVAGPSTGPPSPPVAGSGRVTAGSSDDASDGFELRGGALMVVGGLVALAGLVLGVRALGVAVPTGLVVPVLVVGVGAVIAWSQLDDAQRSRWLGTESGRRGPGVARLVLGLLLAAVGIVALVLRGRSLTDVWDALLATLAVLVGVGLIAAPWVVRLWGDLRAEQVEAARARERADIAAHLHDSVLQTLALIQRRSDDPHTVSQLARAQERELRAYLYAGPTGSQATLAAALTEVAHDVEDVHGIPVDLVVTGDGPLDESSQALVRAFREALLNAVRHGRPPVTAYAEVGASGVEAFVRDHGDGFDLDAVPEDRLGVRESILGRMERHGGRATVRLLDQGTEVALTLPPTQTPASSVTQTRPAAPAQTPGQSATQTRPPAAVAPAPSATHTSAPPATRSPAPSATRSPAPSATRGPAPPATRTSAPPATQTPPSTPAQAPSTTPAQAPPPKDPP